MSKLDLDWIAKATNARSAKNGERIQSLWSGYGEIRRVHLIGATAPSVIAKWVKPPPRARSRSGEESDRGDARKRRSYEVETTFYRHFASRCDDLCRVAHLIDSRATRDEERILLLEDLDASGFGNRCRLPNPSEVDACLAWLAAFHARFIGVEPKGLWAVGTYWHLATRPDELAEMVREDNALKEAAPVIDRKLRDCPFQTLVHGDAKLANFCFSSSDHNVAAVDFQYVGGGCGMKDVAYLVSGRSSALEEHHLDVYFKHLRAALSPSTDIDADALESEWRALYPLACVDFYRFLAGWSKDHWARDKRAKELTRKVLATL